MFPSNQPPAPIAERFRAHWYRRQIENSGS